MNPYVLSTPLFGCLALGLATAGCLGASESASDPTEETTSRTSSAVVQANQPEIARTTLKLESQFSQQFVRGRIDGEALQGAIDDVIQAMPEAARPKVKKHISDVLTGGGKLASELTAEQRAAVTTPPSTEKTGEVHEAIAAWGWPGAGGFGGYGAFAFPGMHLPYGYGAVMAVGYVPNNYSPYDYVLPGGYVYPVGFGYGYGLGNPPGYNPPGYGAFNPPGYNPPGAGYGYGLGYPGWYR
jgi:hypothetical protein